MEQPRVKQLGYGAVIDHVGGKLSTFGEAASIPFAENDQIFDHRGEQKLSWVFKILLCYVIVHDRLRNRSEPK